MNKEIEYKTNWLGEELSVKTGKLAKQADSAVLVQYGETVVLVTVVESQTEREGVDFFPLMVDVEEKLYAAGIIKGSKWVKREGRPSDDSVLTGRMVDRSIRPLFDQTGKKDVQVLISILAVDKKNDHDVIALTAASIALSLNDITWNGPICGIRVGRIAGEFIFNPTYEERLQSDLDLIIASTKSKVIMIEAGANEINEADMNKAIQAGHK
ncbi:MAG: polyribonucleotide nucleotidyltransferase, partial [Candidatus Falkowbacteria bacterium]|nr:polyribonucleotide nucleotidyltransferase [Candidatus Falkowbacteria bacterium]